MEKKKTRLRSGMEVFYSSKEDIKGLEQKIFTRQTYCRHGILVNDGDYIFDIGANIGLATLWFAQQYPKAQIHAFEPIPTNFTALQRNIDLHQINANAHNVGISAQEGSVKFTNYPNTSQMSTMHDYDHKLRRIMKQGMVQSYFQLLPLPLAVVFALTPVKRWREKMADYLLNHHLLRKVTVHCRIETLPGAMQRLNINELHLLKINAQGSEREILTTLPDTCWSKIKQLIIETHYPENQVKCFIQLLNSKGYKVAVENEDLVKDDHIHILYARQV